MEVRGIPAAAPARRSGARLPDEGRAQRRLAENTAQARKREAGKGTIGV